MQGDAGSGVVFEKIPEFPKNKKIESKSSQPTTGKVTGNTAPAIPAIPEIPEVAPQTLAATPVNEDDNPATEIIPETKASAPDIAAPDIETPAPASDIDSMAVMNEGSTAMANDVTVEDAANAALSEADAAIESKTTIAESSPENPGVE